MQIALDLKHASEIDLDQRSAKNGEQYWLMKSEPDVYSYDDLVAEKEGTWDGVRNHTAAINLRAMKKGRPRILLPQQYRRRGGRHHQDQQEPLSTPPTKRRVLSR
jgi:hypothetical protein